jgi:hypothetical protein
MKIDHESKKLMISMINYEENIRSMLKWLINLFKRKVYVVYNVKGVEIKDTVDKDFFYRKDGYKAILKTKRNHSDLKVSVYKNTQVLANRLDDVVTYTVDELFKEIVKGYLNLSMRDFTLACLEGLTDSGGAMENILMSGRADLISGSLRKNLHAVVRESGEDLEKEIQYRFAIFTSTCMSVVRVWDENGRKESLDELADYMEKYLDFTTLWQK